MFKLQSCWLGKIVDNNPVQNNPSSILGLILHNKDTYDTVISFKLHGVSTGLDIRTPSYEDMEILPIYEVTRQLLWESQDTIYAKNDKAAQLSQGVKPIKQSLIMVDTRYQL